jgi:hypothetical protein
MELEEQLRQAGEQHNRLAAELEEAAARRDELIRAAGGRLTRRKIAQLVGISFQRVDQIVRGASRS